jgi:hypothetical protein
MKLSRFDVRRAFHDDIRRRDVALAASHPPLSISPLFSVSQLSSSDGYGRYFQLFATRQNVPRDDWLCCDTAMTRGFYLWPDGFAAKRQGNMR